MKAVTPKYLKARKTGQKFPGSMGPKISAAISFVEGSVKPNAWAIIGDLNDAAELMSGAKGTKVCRDVPDDVRGCALGRRRPRRRTAARCSVRAAAGG